MKPRQNSNDNKLGFTLIELLVVISIISLLASIVLVAMNGVRQKARDAKRVADLRQLATALELYVNDNGQYPNPMGSPGGGSASSGLDSPYWATSTLSSTYVAKMPNDPINITAQYGYYYAINFKPTGPCGYVFTGLNSDYILATRLESSASNSAACQTGVFGGWDNSSLNYIIGQ